jgi:hypothetical protein
VPLPSDLMFSSSVILASSNNSSCVGIHSSSLGLLIFFFCSRLRTFILCAVAADFAAVDFLIDFLSKTIWLISINMF